MRVLLVLAFASGLAAADDRAALLAGVERVGKHGVPGPLACIGAKAFPVAGARLGDGTVHPVVAAASHGRGRVVVFGHGGYLGRRTRLVENAIAWAGRGKTRVRDLRRLEPLDGVDVVVWRGGMNADVAALERFVKRGGGLLIAGLVWGWQQLNPDKSLATDFPLNRLLQPMGILFCDGYTNTILSPGAALAGAHAERALAAPDSLQAASVIASAYRALPAGPSAFRRAVRRRAAKLPADARLAITIRHLDDRALPAAKVRAAPTAADFPGAVPRGAPRLTRTVTVAASVPGWASTGLYAPPGEVVRVRGGADHRLRIGCHTDKLWTKKTWKRHPEISRAFALGDTTAVASPHGGLIYVEVPRGRTGTFEVEIRGAVAAPYFVLGRTDPKSWRATIRNAPAPWAELAATKVILTVRSEDVRALEDPTAILEFWDEVLDLYAELGRRPLDARPQRFVPDRQISAGWLHAGYPIMMQLQHSAAIIDIETLRTDDATKSPGWGFWHELGHNHQRPAWTFQGTTEVTCNLFSLFVDHRVRGIVPKRNSWALNQRASAKRYLKAPDFAQWKKKPGVALWAYIPLQDAFGWELFQRVFEEYARLPRHELPKTDADKRDQWLVRLSRRTGRNLGPYFEAWGIPTSVAARESVAGLPPWMPAFVAGK